MAPASGPGILAAEALLLAPTAYCSQRGSKLGWVRKSGASCLLSPAVPSRAGQVESTTTADVE